MVAGLIARALGGGRFAQIAAALSVFIAPVYLAFHGLLTMNAFEPLFWMACAWVAIRMVEREDPRLWLLFGLIAGIGLLNKYSMASFVIALGVGLLLTPQRRLLLTTWLPGGVLVAFLIILPNLLWQIAQGWPTLELLRNAKLYQYQPVTPLEFVWGQIQIVNPITFPLWISGALFLLRDREVKSFRFLGWAFLVQFVWFMAVEAKNYYLAPIYPLPLAAGCVALERLSTRPPLAWLRPAAIAALLVGGALLAPYVLPVLPISMLPKYLALLPAKEVRPETRRMGGVPQIFADELGWEELVAEVARVYGELAPEERSRAVIWGRSYGEAGAIDYLGSKYGLPKAISGHQNYYLWGPGEGSWEIVIAVNIPQQYLKPWFDLVETRATVGCEYCMPDRMSMPISVCRGLKMPFRDVWPKVKCWTCDRPAITKETPEGS